MPTTLPIRVLLPLWATSAAIAAQSGPALHGTVVDAAGEPVAGATARIATAALREGLSPY